MINYTLPQITAFLTVVETRSFRIASERLHITQSAVSTRIIELERQLGVKLLHRTTRSVIVTQYGERLAAIASRVLTELNDAAESIHSEAKLQQGRLVISSMLSVAETFLPSLMREFTNKYPGVHVELRDVVGDLTVELVSSGRADFGIFTPVIDQEDIVFEPLFRDELFVVVRLDHPLARENTIELSETMKYDIVGPARGMGLRKVIDAAFTEAGLAFAPIQEAGSVSTVLRLVETGFGIAFIPDIFSPRIDFSRCRKISLDGGGFSRTLGILTSRGRALSPAAEAFLSLLRRKVKNGINLTSVQFD